MAKRQNYPQLCLIGLCIREQQNYYAHHNFLMLTLLKPLGMALQ